MTEDRNVEESEVQRQIGRLHHILRETGARPTVLDVEPAAFERMKLELVSDRRWNVKPLVVEDPGALFKHGILLAGVLFICGVAVQ